MAKKRQLFPFILFIFPYLHFALAIDFYFHSVLGIFIALLLLIMLGFYASQTQQMSLLFMGNGLNLLISYLILFFCKPLSLIYPANFIMVTLLFLLFLLAQLISSFWGSFLLNNHHHSS